MSRPAGSKNKPNGLVEPSPLSPVIPPTVRYDAIFGIRNHRIGQWKGQNLWELARLDNEGKRTVLIDATDRRSIINYVVRQIGKIVVA